MELTEYFMWDADGELSALGAWPSFDDVPRTKNDVWLFEGKQELEDFIEQATELLERCGMHDEYLRRNEVRRTGIMFYDGQPLTHPRFRWACWFDKEDVCFVTGEPIGNNDLCRFTYEFNAWVSEEGQRIIKEIYQEWCDQDAAADGKD